MKTTIIVALAVIIQAVSVLANPVSVVDFGAVPNSEQNCIAAFRQAAQVVREHPGSTLLIPPGRYLLRDEEAVKFQEDILAGKFGHDSQSVTFTPYAPYVKGIDLTGARQVTVSGDKAVLVFDGIMEGITLDHCVDVTVRGLTIERKRRPFSEGKIVAVRPGSFDAEFDKDLYPVHANIPVPRMQFWDTSKNRYVPEHYYSVSSAEVAPQTLRFNRNSPLPVGQIVTISHWFFSRAAITVQESRDIRIEDYTAHGEGGNAVAGNRVHNLTLVRVREVPAPGAHHSGNVDATHFTNCSGLLRMEACQFEGQEDDGTNIHCYYHQIIARKDDFTCDTKVTTSYGTHINTLDYFTPGDTVELVERDSAHVVRTYLVKACEQFPKQMKTTVTLDDKLPTETGRYYLLNASRFPKVELVNCVIGSHRARSFLLKSRDVLVEGCSFYGATSTAIQCGAEISWWEGGPVQNVVIRNNRFKSCGTGGEGRHGACAISVELDAPKHSYQVNRNILIEGNIIEGENNACGIYIGNTDGAIIRHNQITGCREDVKVENSTNITVERNQEVKP